MEAINVVEAKSRFSELLSRAASGERILIQRRERAVAVLINPEELARLERAAQAATHLAYSLGQDETILREIAAEAQHPAMAAFGLWRDEEAFAGLAEEILADRYGDQERGEVSFENPG